MVGSTKASSSTEDGYLRKIRKPLVEKRRRDRMNRSIEQLKMLIADSIENFSSTKLDKADILDLTVSHLQQLKNHQSSISMATEASSYSNGFKDCAKESICYLSTTNVITPESLGYLSNHLHAVYDKKTDSRSLEQVGDITRASSPVIQTSSPQYCSTPLQGLHSVLSTSAYSATDSFSDTSVNSDSQLRGPANTSAYSATDSFSDSSAYSDSQLSGPAISVMNISKFSVMDISQTSRRVSGSTGSSLDTYSYSTDLSADTAAGFPRTSDIVLEDVINEEKPWRPW